MHIINKERHILTKWKIITKTEREYKESREGEPCFLYVDPTSGRICGFNVTVPTGPPGLFVINIDA